MSSTYEVHRDVAVEAAGGKQWTLLASAAAALQVPHQLPAHHRHPAWEARALPSGGVSPSITKETDVVDKVRVRFTAACNDRHTGARRRSRGSTGPAAASGSTATGMSTAGVPLGHRSPGKRGPATSRLRSARASATNCSAASRSCARQMRPWLNPPL